MSVTDAVPANHVPIQVKFAETGPTVSWCADVGLEFDDPFFDETAHRCLRRPYNRAFMPKTPIAALVDYADAHAGRSPDAFIFHMSRCGSTLLAQMFTALAHTRVIAEAPAIDRVLHAERTVPALTAETQAGWLRALMRAYGSRARAPFVRHVVKLDAWHIDRVDLIEQAFPGVPWVYLFRHPLEVLVSSLAQRAASTLPGAATHRLPGMDLIDAVRMPAEQYAALILSHNMRCALQHRANPRALFVNYADLPAVALPAILRHFGMALDAAEIAAMLARADRNAKQPAMAFVPDAERKRDGATALARHLSETLLMPIYHELQSIRWRPA